MKKKTSTSKAKEEEKEETKLCLYVTGHREEDSHIFKSAEDHQRFFPSFTVPSQKKNPLFNLSKISFSVALVCVCVCVCVHVTWAFCC